MISESDWSLSLSDMAPPDSGSGINSSALMLLGSLLAWLLLERQSVWLVQVTMVSQQICLYKQLSSKETSVKQICIQIDEHNTEQHDTPKSENMNP